MGEITGQPRDSPSCGAIDIEICEDRLLVTLRDTDTIDYYQLH